MKKINVIIFYLLELISMLSILLLSFFGKMDGDLGLILADEIVYLPVILYVLFTIFLILDFELFISFNNSSPFLINNDIFVSLIHLNYNTEKSEILQKRKVLLHFLYILPSCVFGIDPLFWRLAACFGLFLRLLF